MLNAHLLSCLCAATAVCLVSPDASALPAFPGAEGFGANATGGRGGQVLTVTNLDASGEGSLQWALNEPGPRIIVFAVSGVISADVIEIPHGDVTIAGQTAPGAGVTLAARLYAAYDDSVTNIIIRHVRIRPPEQTGAGEQFDGMQFSRNSNMIFDHISVAYGVDETFDMYEGEGITVQWSTISMGAIEGHPEGEHNYGLIVGPDGSRVSVHHNLFVHQKNRNPALATGPAEAVNNVAYNVRHGYVHHNPASGQHSIIGNYYKRGPDDELFPFFFDDEAGAQLAYYLADNYIDDPGVYQGAVDNPWIEPWVHPSFEYLSKPESHRVEQPFDFSEAEPDYIPITTSTSADAYEAVLACSGGWPRDVVDRTMVMQTEAATGAWGVWRPDDLLEGLSVEPAVEDSDGDGMPDTWETANNLDPSDGTDHDTVTDSGYTAIERYINEVADSFSDCVVPDPPGGDEGGDDDGTDDGTGDDDPDGGTNDGSNDGSASAGEGGGGNGTGGSTMGNDGTAAGGSSGQGATDDDDDSGCGCSTRGSAPIGVLVMGMLMFGLRRRPTPTVQS